MATKQQFDSRADAGESRIHTQDAAPPVPIPNGHIGPVVLPGTGRMVWWTGRVAIGLRHQPTRHFGPITQSALWVQSLMLNTGRSLQQAL
ncbi:MAG: hypothetical protein Q8L49_11045 [Burkholderiaceae bacterium]|nr:hypothetical protein [Burkholderiaceae bacterium]